MTSKRKKETNADKINSIYADMVENIQSLAANIISIVSDVNKKTKKKENKLELEPIIQLILNFVLNEQDRVSLMSNYIKRVYVHKEKIDNREIDFFFDENSIFDDCGVPEAFVDGVKSLFRILWDEHMEEKEQGIVFDIFDNFNNMSEDWLKLGGHRVLREIEDKEWAKTYKFLLRVERSLVEVAA